MQGAAEGQKCCDRDGDRFRSNGLARDMVPHRCSLRTDQFTKSSSCASPRLASGP